MPSEEPAAGAARPSSVRQPQISVTILGELYEEFHEWSVQGENLVLWIADLPTALVEGESVDLAYFGSSEGDTASAIGTEITSVEPAHGGFHVALQPESDFLSAIIEAEGVGMRCHECDKEHCEWEKDGEHAVDDRHNVGIIARWECGNCGAITEVPRR